MTHSQRITKGARQRHVESSRKSRYAENWGGLRPGQGPIGRSLDRPEPTIIL
ncbi:Uu.00g125590.m01.CDS01 [Anthostomella pinea]|uniref:Uu.00g125590.m01.CDS01 n=1 Tax=Anthostomella pinea TaxID=933095 RepID=A0AAI8VHT2_9PEZI|nr:Uu.00g125590.m01.CDS01 [Anthostomella pinea]